MAWYNTIKRMIAAGRTSGLLERVNNMYVYGQLTDEQYGELIEGLTADSIA